MNSNSQEAQQSQTIADARKWAAEESAWLSRQTLPQSESVEHMDGVLQIVDSQAQKIAEARQAAESIRARYTARIAGDSQAKHYERADSLFPWEKL